MFERKPGDMDNRGTYFTSGEFIALRDDESKLWRLSRVSVNQDTSLTLTLIGEYEHKWEVLEQIDKMSPFSLKKDI